MSDDEEVLRTGSVLYNHLADEGYVDFETYQTPKRNLLENIGIQPSCDSLDVDYHLSLISSCDHSNTVKILNSKLLLVEDAQLVKGILQTRVVNNKPKWHFIAIATSLGLFSSILLFKKEVRISIPISLTAVCSSYFTWQLIKSQKERREVKLVDCYLRDLLNLTINIHKLLRFLKETEILSTGQVSRSNVAAATYMVPVIKELDQYPSWKTLPHLRKCLADSLEEAVKIMFDVCNKATDILPDWMKIEGYTYSNQVALHEKLLTIRDQNKSVGCSSIKDLQILNSVYLALQSEYLRCIAIIFSSGNECVLKKRQNKPDRRLEIFKLMSETKPKITSISLKLKNHLDLHLLYYTDQTDEENEKHKDKKTLEMDNLQTEVHSLFLSVLLIVKKIRELEDHLEDIYSSRLSRPTTTVDDIKEEFTHELNTIRNDLTGAIKNYDEIFNLFTSKKNQEVNDGNRLQSDTEDVNFPSNQHLFSKTVTVNEPDWNINVDEVFIGKSGSKDIDKKNNCTDHWGSEVNFQVPKTLLSELSETLKPIKEDFMERERKALARAGIHDIEEKENPVLGSSLKSCNIHISSSKKDYMHEENLNDDSAKANLKKCDYDRPDLFEKPNHGESFIFNTSFLAKTVAKKSQEWGKNSEQFYSDD